MKNISFNIGLFFKILIPFLCAQVLGLYTAFKLLPHQQALGISSATLGDVTNTAFTSTLILQIIIWILVSILLMWLTLHFRRIGMAFYKIFLIFVVLSGTQVVLWLISPTWSLLASLVILVLFLKLRTVLMHNIVMVLTFAGIGAVLGLSVSPMLAVMILLLLSFYDIWAVYKTGHMVKLATMMMEARAIFGFIIPDSMAHINEHVNQVEPGGRFMILGSGDVIIPMLLVISVVRYSLPQAIVVLGFTLFGLALMQLLFQNQSQRRPMAALPPIALLSILGYLASSLF